MAYSQLNSGTPYSAGGNFDETDANIIQEDLRLLPKGQYTRNKFLGGLDFIGIRGSAAVDLLNGLPFTIDNTSTQLSGSTVQVRFYLRVGNSGITVQPRIYNKTAAGAATTSGGTTTSGTARDWSGTDQIQTLTLTLASGVNEYIAQITPSAATYPVYAKAWLHLYI